MGGRAGAGRRRAAGVPLFGSEVFPPRLWVYSNFHCNLACSYCVVASSPGARKRVLGLDRFRALVDEAVDEGFAELYVTGGEPFVEPDIVAMLEYASDRLPTVVLTNAMLFSGRRRAELARLAGRANLVLQSSVDGARPATHDAWRGAGSWAKAMEGLAYARELGLPLRVAMTETPENRERGRRAARAARARWTSSATRSRCARWSSAGSRRTSRARWSSTRR